MSEDEKQLSVALHWDITDLRAELRYTNFKKFDDRQFVLGALEAAEELLDDGFPTACSTHIAIIDQFLDEHAYPSRDWLK